MLLSEIGRVTVCFDTEAIKINPTLSHYQTCKDNVQGDKCDSCKPKYYDWPTCTRKHFQKEYIK